MQEFTFRRALTTDASALVELANQYTYQHLTETERQQGFLTGTFTVPALQAMLSSVPGQLAHHQQDVVGFVVNSKLAPERYPPLVQAICLALPNLRYRNLPLVQYRWFFYGPVLVKSEYRGQGLLTRLFEATKQELRSRFNLGIAFIAEQNPASLRLHTQKLGLEVVGTLPFQDTQYTLLVFPLT